MPLESDLIAACNAAIEAGEVMSDGRRPTVAAIEARLGRDVTAEERDAAVEALNAAAIERENKTGGDTGMRSTSHDIEESGKQEALVYIGPTIRSPHLVKSGTVFRSLPAAVAELKETNRNFSRMFVPVGGLAAARRRLTDKQGVLSRAYLAVLATYGRVS